MNTYTLVALGSAVAAFVVIRLTKGRTDVRMDEQAETGQKQATNSEQTSKSSDGQAA